MNWASIRQAQLIKARVSLGIIGKGTKQEGGGEGVVNSNELWLHYSYQDFKYNPLESVFTNYDMSWV